MRSVTSGLKSGSFSFSFADKGFTFAANLEADVRTVDSLMMRPIKGIVCVHLAC